MDDPMAMQFDEFEFFASEPPSGAPAVEHEAASPLVRLQYLIDNTPAIIYCPSPAATSR